MTRRACTGPMPSCSRSSRNQARSSAGLATTRAAARKSLTWAASVNRSPPYLTNGMLRALTARSPARRCGAPRGPAPPGRAASAPASWAASTRAQISRAWVASSWQRTSSGGRAPAPRSAVSASSRPADCGRTALASRSTACLGPVVAVQPDDGQPGVGAGQLPQVRRVGAAEPVDGLRVVADAGQPLPVRLQQPHDVGLDRVDVLVLIDQDRVEHAAQHRPGGRVGQRGPPQQQQVIEVDQAVAALVRDVAAEQPGELAGEVAHHGKLARDHLADRRAGCSRTGCRCRRTPPPAAPAAGRADQAVVGAQRVQQVGHVGRVDDGELRRQRERLGVRADDLVRDRVERPAADPLGGAARPRRDARASMSSAARRVNVSSRIRLAGTPWRRAARPPAPPASASCRCPPRPAPAAARPGASRPAAAARSARPARRAVRTCI